MANVTALCTSFKQEILVATHNLTAAQDALKLALYTSTASLSASTTAYSATNEITNAAGTAYTAAGIALTNVTPTTSGTTAFADFNDVSWTTASFTANAGLIYNTTRANKAISTHLFGDQTVSVGTFTIVFPTADATNAIIRIA